MAQRPNRVVQAFLEALPGFTQFMLDCRPGQLSQACMATRVGTDLKTGLHQHFDSLPVEHIPVNFPW